MPKGPGTESRMRGRRRASRRTMRDRMTTLQTKTLLKTQHARDLGQRGKQWKWDRGLKISSGGGSQLPERVNKDKASPGSSRTYAPPPQPTWGKIWKWGGLCARPPPQKALYFSDFCTPRSHPRKTRLGSTQRGVLLTLQSHIQVYLGSPKVSPPVLIEEIWIDGIKPK